MFTRNLANNFGDGAPAEPQETWPSPGV